MARTTRELVLCYYDSLAQKNDGWQELYAHDAVFSDAAHILDAEGKANVIRSFTPFLQTVTNVAVKQLIVEGEVACAIVRYHYHNAKQQTLEQDVAEVWQVADNQLKRLTIYFDLTAYRAFMRG